MEVLHLLLVDQACETVETILAYWKKLAPADSILVAHGGRREDFEALKFARKVYVSDPRLRTRDHHRQKQSYTGVFQAAAEWLKTPEGKEFRYVLVSEYDHLPLAKDLDSKLIGRLTEERADVLGFELIEIDGSSSPGYLFHTSDPAFLRFWESVSVRENKGVVLSMFGSGSFWTREAFCAVAGRREEAPVYLEIYLPTMAHHLGYRLRDFGDQSRYIFNLRDRTELIDEAREAGAWTIHPIKAIETWRKLGAG